MRAYSKRVSAACHKQRAQVQEGCLVQRLREQIRNLFFGRHPVDGDHELQVELTAIAQPNFIVFGARCGAWVDS